jgi:hypothetical protein
MLPVMPLKIMKRQKLYSSLLILGASILLFRTIRLLTVENGWEVLAGWVIILTFIEMAIDLFCINFSFKWLFNNNLKSRKYALRLGASAAIFHAFRVFIYLIGRIGPWYNFDVKPQFRSSHDVDMFWVYFAVTLSVLGILGVIVIWIKTKNRKR